MIYRCIQNKPLTPISIMLLHIHISIPKQSIIKQRLQHYIRPNLIRIFTWLNHITITPLHLRLITTGDSQAIHVNVIVVFRISLFVRVGSGAGRGGGFRVDWLALVDVDPLVGRALEAESVVVVLDAVFDVVQFFAVVLAVGE